MNKAKLTYRITTGLFTVLIGMGAVMLMYPAFPHTQAGGFFSSSLLEQPVAPDYLTLGALAALETRLESGSLMELAERFESGAIGSQDLIALLSAGLQGGGSKTTEAELANADIAGGAVGALHAGMELLARAFQPLDHG